MDNDAIAHRLYGGSTPAPAVLPSAPVVEPSAVPAAESAAPAEKPAEPVAQNDGGLPPDNILELRNTLERRMYSAQKTFESVPTGEWARLVPGIDEVSAQALEYELKEVAVDHGFTPEEFKDFAAVIGQIDPATKADWGPQAVQQLQARYGQGAEEALRDAHALMTRDPRTAAGLRASGLANHPMVVLKFAELARRRRA